VAEARFATSSNHNTMGEDDRHARALVDELEVRE
jgi:hypothetical protein